MLFANVRQWLDTCKRGRMFANMGRNVWPTERVVKQHISQTQQRCEQREIRVRLLRDALIIKRHMMVWIGVLPTRRPIVGWD